MTDVWREMLHTAADKIKADGWCQKTLHCDGKHCAYGALIADIRTWSTEQNKAFGQTVSALRSLVGKSISKWNDAPERTEEEVIATLRLAAER